MGQILSWYPPRLQTSDISYDILGLGAQVWDSIELYRDVIAMKTMFEVNHVNSIKL